MLNGIGLPSEIWKYHWPVVNSNIGEILNKLKFKRSDIIEPVELIIIFNFIIKKTIWKVCCENEHSQRYHTLPLFYCRVFLNRKTEKHRSDMSNLHLFNRMVNQFLLLNQKLLYTSQIFSLFLSFIYLFLSESKSEND